MVRLRLKAMGQRLRDWTRDGRIPYALQQAGAPRRADRASGGRRRIFSMRHDTSYPKSAPETPATLFLRKHGVAHSNHFYEYE